MNYFVYILLSKKLGKFYIGTTTDVDRRLEEHNSTHYKNAFSAKGVPWTIFMSIRCDSSDEAYKLERFIKKMKSAAFIHRLKDDPEILASIFLKIR